MKKYCFTYVLFVLLFDIVTAHAEIMLSGYMSLDGRAYREDPLYDNQGSGGTAFVLNPEFYQQLDIDDQGISFIPFLRIDSQDNDRSHFDVRELMWSGMSETYSWKVGVNKVFWGVTESQHLVDIVNQVDLLEEPTLETKLGQTMLNLTWINDYGHIEGYILPGFRERQFPGERGRLRSEYEIVETDAVYESERKNKHVDLAVRWFTLLGGTEAGLSYFTGTNREPEMVPELRNGALVLIPHYNKITQTGLDISHQSNRWTWKLEGFLRHGQGDDQFHAFTGGFEYAYTGAWLKGADVSWLLEYMYDSRGDQATTPFEHDIFAGLRIGLNDLNGSEIRINSVMDTENAGVIYTAQMSRRISDEWKMKLLGRVYSNTSDQDFIYSFRKDDYLELELARYF